MGFVFTREQQEFDHGYVANESSMYFAPYLPSYISFLLALMRVGWFCL